MIQSSHTTCRYSSLLREFLQGGRKTIPAALFAGDKETLFSSASIASRIRTHEAVVSACLPPKAGKLARAGARKRAARFFAHALVSPESSPMVISAMEALCLHIMEQSAQQNLLKQALKDNEDALLHTRSNQLHYELLLKKSEAQQAQLRRLSRQLLSAQEDERRKISRELHDVIAQTLTGINIKLATLKKQSTGDLKIQLRSINSTQRLVEKSVAIIHQFACELRPSVIDVLGLVPALETLARQFSARTGIHTTVRSSNPLTQLDSAQRTCLFRVVEEALTNADRHSAANKVDIRLSKGKWKITMTIHDNGKSFCVLTATRNENGKHLGLLGMRERVEMMHGTFLIESAPALGTTITASIPAIRPKRRKPSSKAAS